MAREDEDDGLLPIGEDTTKFLEEAKKGKPRSFLMICKGVDLRYLLVKKKAIKKSEIAEAKKLGYKGEAYIGVITGKGMDLVFNLSTADGYDSEPCKEKVLKDFLEEHAEIKAKPSFAIVSSLPEIPFDDEDLNHPLIQRFLGLAEQITKVLDAKPELESEISNRTQAIRGLLQDGSFNQAEPMINELENQLKAWLSGQGGAGQSVQEGGSGSTSTDQDPLRAKLQEALNKLVPQLKQAVTTFPDKKVELLTPVASIKEQLASGQLQEARQGILQVGQFLKNLLSGANVPQTGQNSGDSNSVTSESLEKEYREKLSVLEPLFRQAITQTLGDTSKFQAVMAYIRGQGGEKAYANAIKAIDKLTQAVQDAINKGVKDTDVIPKGLVADRKKFILSRWQQALADAKEEVRKLAGPIAELVPDEEPDTLVDGMIGEIDELADEINNSIFSAQTSSEGNQKPLQQALDAIIRFKKNLPNKQLISLLDEAKKSLGTDVKVKDVLLEALDALEAKLAN